MICGIYLACRTNLSVAKVDVGHPGIILEIREHPVLDIAHADTRRYIVHLVYKLDLLVVL